MPSTCWGFCSPALTSHDKLLRTIVICRTGTRPPVIFTHSALSEKMNAASSMQAVPDDQSSLKRRRRPGGK